MVADKWLVDEKLQLEIKKLQAEIELINQQTIRLKQENEDFIHKQNLRKFKEE